VNAALPTLPLWQGQHLVALRAADIADRSGDFCEDDALYYSRFFTPADAAAAMPDDVLDVTKLRDHWNERLPHNAHLLAEDTFLALRSLIAIPGRAAVNEYFCHEVGHLMGLDVHRKYDAGYFKHQGRPLWPLIFVEEHRADLHGLGVAAELLPPEQSCEVFAYHLLHRFGLAASSAAGGGAGAGLVPFLLFGVLRRLGIIDPRPFGGRPRLVVGGCTPESVARHLRRCGEYVTLHLTRPEIDAPELADAALCGAGYFRSFALDDDCSASYADLLGTSAT
jgi:hypothetical protein